MINSGLGDLSGLRKNWKNMSEQEKETENPNEIVNLVKNILELNKQQQEQGLKILTPNQMLYYYQLTTNFFSSIKSRK